MRTLLSRVVCTLIICCFRERVAPVHVFEPSHGSPSIISLWKQQRIQLIRYIWLLTSIVATIDYHSNLYAERSFILYNVLRHEYSIYASTSQQLGLASLISTFFVYLSFHEYPRIFFFSVSSLQHFKTKCTHGPSRFAFSSTTGAFHIQVLLNSYKPTRLMIYQYKFKRTSLDELQNSWKGLPFRPTPTLALPRSVHTISTRHTVEKL
jgi:hypothetical protein